MMLELNEVLLEHAQRTCSMMAYEGRLACLTGGDAKQRSRLLLAILGMLPLRSGCISIDGEPLTPLSAPTFRRSMAYVPAQLTPAGEIKTYDPPSVQDVFELKANRDLPISNGILAEEVRRVTPTATSDERAQLLAVAVLLNKPILLAEDPLPQAATYLQRYAAQKHVVIVTSEAPEILAAAHTIVEI